MLHGSHMGSRIRVHRQGPGRIGVSGLIELEERPDAVEHGKDGGAQDPEDQRLEHEDAEPVFERDAVDQLRQPHHEQASIHGQA